MFNSDKIFVHISDDIIKILVGNNKKVTHAKCIKTPEGSFQENEIINSDIIGATIKKYISSINVMSNKISFAIDGQDIVIRHIETPIIKEEGLKNAVKWDISQQLPNNGDGYYIDHQIIEKFNDQDKQGYKLLVVAVPKQKIDSYVELAKKMNFQISNVDISANCIARVFNFSPIQNKNVQSTGIINIGESFSSLIILDKGNLFFEREIPYGLNDIINELAEKIEIPEPKIKDDFDDEDIFELDEELESINESDEDQFGGLSTLENIMISFDNMIQFFTTGKSKKSLDYIYVIGLKESMLVIKDSISNYFNTPATVINSLKDLNINMKLPQEFDLKRHMNTLGLLLRKE